MTKYYPICPELSGVLSKGKLGSQHSFMCKHERNELLFTTLVTAAIVSATALSESFLLPLILA